MHLEDDVEKADRLEPYHEVVVVVLGKSGEAGNSCGGVTGVGMMRGRST